MGYVEKGDEQGARDFLVENIAKFPDDIRDKLVFIFFEEALMQDVNAVKQLAEAEQESVKAVNQIEKAQKILEEKLKIEKLKSDLDQ